MCKQVSKRKGIWWPFQQSTLWSNQWECYPGYPLTLPLALRISPDSPLCLPSCISLCFLWLPATLYHLREEWNWLILPGRGIWLTGGMGRGIWLTGVMVKTTMMTAVFVLKAFGFPGGSASKETACNAGHLGSIPGLERSPGEGNGKPLQYSCLEGSMDGGAWWASALGVPKSQTRLKD